MRIVYVSLCAPRACGDYPYGSVGYCVHARLLEPLVAWLLKTELSLTVGCAAINSAVGRRGGRNGRRSCAKTGGARD